MIKASDCNPDIYRFDSCPVLHFNLTSVAQLIEHRSLTPAVSSLNLLRGANYFISAFYQCGVSLIGKTRDSKPRKEGS